MAAIVSSSRIETFFEDVEEELLFTSIQGTNSFPFFSPWNKPDPLCLPFPEALRAE